ncbi:MAG: cytochrome C [Nitrospirota bacterium]|nr:cytochrome C [Nitrospirota bacterium]
MAVLTFPHSALAGPLERLVMPGELISGHAKYEDTCTNCHKRFSKGVQNNLCLDCHKDVASDVGKKRGFHGRSPQVANQECQVCHTDHVGRSADVVGLNRETFDHNQTDYRLKGRHQRVRCDGCHKPDKKFRDAPATCLACHKEDDAHDGRLGEKCEDCHSTAGWKKTAFDHDKTDFPLRDSHMDVACAMCHPGEKYKGVPDTCVACHKINDVHRGANGDKCEDCHTPDKWDRVRFDHDKDTDFPLKGSHKEVTCKACHTGDLYKDELKTDCHSCHKNDDEHKGRYGEKCDSCHTPRAWDRVIFDHDKDTDFRLKGAHEKARCRSCHKGVLYKEELKTDCYACHKGDDVHDGRQGENCAQCHRETGWRDQVRFDHDLTPFPLIGQHAVTPCEECHLDRRYVKTEGECYACHKKQDEHKRRLGSLCGTCHNPNGWPLWSFDHNRQTEFKLDGKHEGLDCLACHKTPSKKGVKQPNTCGACHLQDDVHSEQFGRDCGRCHTTESFSDITIER